MYMFSTIYVFIALLIIVVPMFVCDYPEVFEHNVNLEFLADNLYEIKLRMAKQIKESIKNAMANQLKNKAAFNSNNSAANETELMIKEKEGESNQSKAMLPQSPLNNTDIERKSEETKEKDADKVLK